MSCECIYIHVLNMYRNIIKIYYKFHLVVHLNLPTFLMNNNYSSLIDFRSLYIQDSYRKSLSLISDIESRSIIRREAVWNSNFLVGKCITLNNVLLETFHFPLAILSIAHLNMIEIEIYILYGTFVNEKNHEKNFSKRIRKVRIWILNRILIFVWQQQYYIFISMQLYFS